jgi:hypothetical protein
VALGPDVLEKLQARRGGPHHRQYTHWDWEPLCEAILRLDCTGMTAARPPERAAQLTAESQPAVAAAPSGGSLQAPVYGMQYDASFHPRARC